MKYKKMKLLCCNSSPILKLNWKLQVYCKLSRSQPTWLCIRLRRFKLARISFHVANLRKGDKQMSLSTKTYLYIQLLA